MLPLEPCLATPRPIERSVISGVLPSHGSARTLPIVLAVMDREGVVIGVCDPSVLIMWVCYLSVVVRHLILVLIWLSRCLLFSLVSPSLKLPLDR